jgi:biopolymer transport protein ExbD
MQRALIFVAVLACAAGCSASKQSRSNAEWVASSLPDASEPAATIRLTADEAGNGCASYWNGEAVTNDQLAQHTREIMDTAVTVAGGIDHMTAGKIPYLKLEVAPDLNFACVEPALAAIREIGYSRVGLKPDLTAPSAHFVHFPLTQVGAAAPSVTVAINSRGGMTWNGEQVDLAGLGARAHPLASAGSEPGNGGSLIIVPAHETAFSAIYEAVKVIRENGVEPDLAA